MADMMDSGTLRSRMQEIDPYEFEEFVADLWEEEGWDTSVTRSSSDEGVDVEAVKSGTIDQKLVIQAKRYSDGNKVGRPDVQRYHSLKTQDTDADAAVVVTTSDFTDQAKAWAYDHNVKLVDGDDLAEMVREHGREDLIDEYAPEEGAEEQEAATTESAKPSPSASLTEGRLGSVVIVTLVQIGSLALMMSPSLVPAVPANLGTYAFLATWFAVPIVIYEDLKAIEWGDGTKMGAAVWIVGSFAFIVIVPIWYVYRRITR